MFALHLPNAHLHRCQQLQQGPTHNRGGRASTTRVYAADAFCKDMVNERKQVAATGTAIVTFMGAEGSSVAVEVPKVGVKHNTVCNTWHRLVVCTASDSSPGVQDAYILDAGLDAGLELPYTCRGGICG
jgi:hypothetical protein